MKKRDRRKGLSARRGKLLLVGARCKKHICYGVDAHNGNCKDTPISGRIVYVHPQGRFYTVEFPMPHGTLRESYWCCPAWKDASLYEERIRSAPVTGVLRTEQA